MKFVFRCNVLVILIILVHQIKFVASYIGVSTPLTWENAELFCQDNFNTHLASVHSSTVNDEDILETCTAITPFFTGSPASEAYCWLGLNDLNEEGVREWTDSSTVDYTQILNEDRLGNDPEPQDCFGVMDMPRGSGSVPGDWVDTNCNNEWSFICNDISNNNNTKEILASSNACFNGGNAISTIFNAPKDGILLGIRLVRNSGSFNCFTNNYWGCEAQGGNIRTSFLKVTDATNYVGTQYYPRYPVTKEVTSTLVVSDCSAKGSLYYYYVDAGIYATEFTLTYPSYYVTTSDQFMLQHYNGHCNHFPTSGTVCASVYFIYDDMPCTNVKQINWHSLQNAVDNTADIPYSNFTISVDSNTLQTTFNIDLEYVGNSKDGNFDNNFNLGTTYVVDFQSFKTNGNSIDKPGNCQNRMVSSFTGINNFNDYWNYSEYPHSDGELGSNQYLSYPPPSQYWTLTMDAYTCTPINYNGIFSWNDLTQCQDYNGNDLIDVIDDGTSITLSGTLYVNLVSPYSMSAVDTGIYRTFPLIQQDFEISILKQINVLSSTGVELFITSIIGIYEDESDSSFELSILTQSADYIKLINPTVLATPFGIATGVSITSTSTTCLSASTYTCGQIFTLSISSDEINCPPADMSGVYDIAFDVECRFNESVCNTFINDNPSGTSVALSVESNFIDTYCEPEIYSVIFEGNMTFYDDVEFLIDHSISGNNYVIGQDTIYVEIVVDFPEDGSVNNYYNVFQVDIENVFVCTADDTIDMTQDLDQQNGNGGCLSSNIDADGAYDIIINGVEMNYDSNIILTATESNVVRFSFKTFDIGRTKVYVHAQLLLTLINGARRRLSYQLLSVSDNLENSESTNSNQIRHFVDSTTFISNDESINMFSTKINNKENNSDKASNKWMKSVMISSVLSLIGVYFMM